MSLALYRKYRPATFAEVVGQEHVTEPLQQALRSNRVHHAYLFSGPRGCGKTSSARILARALNCDQGPTPEPCGTCRSCVELAPNGPGSIDVVEIDAASHGGVDDARDLREKAFFAPVASRFKVYVIDEAHMVSREGFNALLKLVEEPPEHLKFVFATTEPEKVLQTIRSRTHHYPFRLVAPRALEAHLRRIAEAEAVTIDEAALALVVRAGGGSVRDSMSVLDQLIAGSGEDGVTYALAASLLGFSEESLIDDVIDAFAAHDAGAMFRAVDRVVETGHDPRRFAEDLLERLRDLLVLESVPDAADHGIVRAPADKLERLRLQAARFGPAELTRAADVVNTGLADMRGAVAPRLLLEIVCARVLLPGVEEDARGAHARLDRLERRLDMVGPGASAPPQDLRAAPRDEPQDASPTPVKDAALTQPSPEPAPANTEKAGPQTRAVGTPVATEEEAPARATISSETEPPSVGASAEAPSAPAGVDVHAIRQLWPQVLERVKQSRRVTWMLLMEQVQVTSLDDRVLVLAFANEGKRRAFSGSGHDEIVRQALIDVLGLDRRIDAVLDPNVATAGPSPAATAPTSVQPNAPSPADESAASTGSAGGPPDGPSDPDGAASEDGRSAPVHEPASVSPATPTVRPEDDRADDDDEDADDPDVAGADLVARELGGKVIGEFGPG